MANVDITVKMIDKTSGPTQSQVKALQDLSAMAAVAAVAGRAMKEAYDFAREGAQLEYTASKFDRLAESIGTTSDALIRDLQKATKGTMSEMELMAATTDLVGLGLAKNHDEAVRLATVSSGLNMNMNQLVLTLTNMTTMRFDALGVSVDGFKEKVKELEAAGMSAEEAFREAFLQQAEEQMKKVGNAADENIGSFLRLEAAMKDNSDTAKMLASQGLSPLIKYLADSTSRINETASKLQLLDEELYKQYMAHKVLTPEMQALIASYERSAAMADYYTQLLENNTEAAQDNAESIQDMISANNDLLNLTMSIQDANEDYSESMTELVEKQASLNSEIATAIATYGENSEQVAELRDRYNEVGEEIADVEAKHRSAMNSIIFDLILAKAKAEGFTDAQYNMVLQAGVGLGVIDEGAAETASAITTLMEAVDESGGTFEEFGSIAQGIMADGIISAEELQATLDELNANEATDSFKAMQGELDKVDTTNAQAEVNALTDTVYDLINTIDDVPRSINIDTSVDDRPTTPQGEPKSRMAGSTSSNYYITGPVTIVMSEGDQLIGVR